MSRSVTCLLLTLAFAGCPSKNDINKESPPPPPPPPSTTAAAGACAAGGGEVKDPTSSAFFPRTSGGYCLDPQGETKTYGENAKHPREEVCTTLFDGECEVYMRYKLTRVVALRYVDGLGKGATVDVYLSTFADPNGAYGMYTKRVIADSDPADESAPKSIPAGGAAVMGTGRAYMWKGQNLVELQYNNEQESPEQIAKSSSSILPTLAKDMGTRLPGPGEKPPSARALPEADLISPSAIQYETKDALGLANVGPAAIGFYKDSAGKRYRLVALTHVDADQAKDAMKSIQKRPEALPVAGVAEEAVHVSLKSGDKKIEYAFSRKGPLVAGVGDEEYAKGPRLTKDDKIAKLKAWLGAPAPGADAGKK